MADDATHDALTELITGFNDLNGPAIDEFNDEPSPLEFMRHVARNTPFVVRKGASSWKATREWCPAYLKQALGTQSVNVAVTPKGNADAPTFSPTYGSKVISKPHEEEQPFSEFLDHVIRQETDPAFPRDAEVRYAQTQNDNFRNEYVSLFSDAQKDIAFARIALQRKPEAINLWIGNSRSVTALHRDPMENIYVQIIGQKHFVLLSPLCHACVNEQLLAPATYSRSGEGLELRIDNDSEPVPLATWDPDDPQTNPTDLSHLAQPMHVTLNSGDMLYLPAMWYHKVKQSSTDQGCVVAVNYWYDMDFGGPFYSATSFVRSIGLDTQAKKTKS